MFFACTPKITTVSIDIKSRAFLIWRNQLLKTFIYHVTYNVLVYFSSRISRRVSALFLGVHWLSNCTEQIAWKTFTGIGRCEAILFCFSPFSSRRLDDPNFHIIIKDSVLKNIIYWKDEICNDVMSRIFSLLMEKINSYVNSDGSPFFKKMVSDNFAVTPCCSLSH